LREPPLVPAGYYADFGAFPLTIPEGGDSMRRSLITLVVVAVAVVFAAGQALAFQCPKLVAQITAAAATRYDATAADVKDKVAMVQQLHSEGKHAESEKLGKELLEKLK